MSFSRSKIIEKLYEGFGGHVRQKYGASQWNCQKKVKGHYPNPLDYDKWLVETLNWDGRHRSSDPSDPNVTYDPDDPINAELLAAPAADVASRDIQDAVNRANAKFVANMKDSAQNANNILEAGQSVGQILQHVRAISSSIHAVKRGDIGGAAKALGISLDSKGEKRIKQRAKQAADRWLELHFGWEPLVQDIGSSIDILQGTGKSGVSFQRIKGSASFNGNKYSTDTQLVWPYFDTTHDSFSWNGGVVMRGLVAVENPNLAIANQMGFVNPLSVAWEAVPFSFVADWFSNAGQCLSAMTDFWGYQLKQGSTSVLAKTWYGHDYKRTVATFPFGRLEKQTVFQVKRLALSRSGGLLSPVFQIRLPKAVSVTRGATAISLLVQQMRHV